MDHGVPEKKSQSNCLLFELSVDYRDRV